MTWVGTSSIETTINVEQLGSVVVGQEEWNLVMVARFVLVARDPTNRLFKNIYNKIINL